MKRALALVATVMALVLCGCAFNQGGAVGDSTAGSASAAPRQTSITYCYASEAEGRDLLLSNEEYLAGFSQNDLDFRMQKSGATMEEYRAFVADQVREFTDDEKAFLDEKFARMATTLAEQGYAIPPLDEIVLVKTTMAEECDAGAYTHGTAMYLSAEALDELVSAEKNDEDVFDLTLILWHELFHCLTRCNPGFRVDMYKLIHFTVHDTDYTLPPSVVEYHISNPDVEHHDSSATFTIGEKDVECFTDFVTTQHFQKEGDNFFDCGTTALVPVDGTDVYYTPDQAANFDEVFGRNTDFVIDPEECMADNFSFALTYGAEGEDGNGYESPQIIDGILEYLQQP